MVLMGFVDRLLSAIKSPSRCYILHLKAWRCNQLMVKFKTRLNIRALRHSVSRDTWVRINLAFVL